MKNSSNFETFLFLGPSKIEINVIDKQKNESFYSNKKILENNIQILDIEILDEFLKKNIYEIEKKMEGFVEKINLILESKEFFTIQVSIKKNTYGDLISKKNFIHLLNEVKDECKNTISERKIIHMIIDNYLVDGKNTTTIEENLKCKTFSMDIKLICLSLKYIGQLEKIFKNYQISINHILYSDYVKSLFINDDKNIFKMAIQSINGYNRNEVFIIPKVLRNKGFFERFFNFFN